jgi:hypothetical protein
MSFFLLRSKTSRRAGRPPRKAHQRSQSARSACSVELVDRIPTVASVIRDPLWQLPTQEFRASVRSGHQQAQIIASDDHPHPHCDIFG